MPDRMSGANFLYGVTLLLALSGSADAMMQTGCGSMPPVIETTAEHGAWEGPWMFKSNVTGSCTSGSACLVGSNPCVGAANGIAHALLIPMGSHAGRVLFVTQLGRVVVWNPAEPDILDGSINCSFPGPGDSTHWGCDYNVFCAGHTPLSDGRFMFAGGADFTFVNGIRETTLFNPTQADGSVDPWEHGPQMIKNRYYPTVIAMLKKFDALPLVVGGTEFVAEQAGNGIREWERLDNTRQGTDCNSAATNWDIDELTDPGVFTEFEYYPRMHQLADELGTVFIAGDTNSAKTQLCGGTGNGVGATWFLVPPAPNAGTSGTLISGPTDPFGNRYYGSSVLLHQMPENGGANRVILFGGSDGCNVPGSPCCNGAVIVQDAVVELDFQPNGTSQFVVKAPLLCPRVFSNAVILPTGDVFISRGSLVDHQNDITEAVPYPHSNPEIYSPGASKSGGSSKYVAAITDIVMPCNPEGAGKPARVYHHVALLLKDGRVLVAGGNDVCGHGSAGYTGEVFSPPYMFQSFSTDLSNAPEDVYFRQPFSLSFSLSDVPATATIDRVVLIRTGSVTHHQDYSQRYVELSYEITSIATPLENPGQMVGTIQAVAPGPHRAPPGYYLLFVIGSEGGIRVPSQGELVRLQ